MQTEIEANRAVKGEVLEVIARGGKAGERKYVIRIRSEPFTVDGMQSMYSIDKEIRDIIERFKTTKIKKEI
jgi:hypothetical protein